MANLHSRIVKLEKKMLPADPPAAGDAVATFVASLRRLIQATPLVEPDPLAEVTDELVFEAYDEGLAELLPQLPEKLRSRVRNKFWSGFLDHMQKKHGAA
jgi:hypothetical protein